MVPVTADQPIMTSMQPAAPAPHDVPLRRPALSSSVMKTANPDGRGLARWATACWWSTSQKNEPTDSASPEDQGVRGGTVAVASGRRAVRFITLSTSASATVQGVGAGGRRDPTEQRVDDQQRSTVPRYASSMAEMVVTSSSSMTRGFGQQIGEQKEEPDSAGRVAPRGILTPADCFIAPEATSAKQGMVDRRPRRPLTRQPIPAPPCTLACWNTRVEDSTTHP